MFKMDVKIFHLLSPTHYVNLQAYYKLAQIFENLQLCEELFPIKGCNPSGHPCFYNLKTEANYRFKLATSAFDFECILKTMPLNYTAVLVCYFSFSLCQPNKKLYTVSCSRSKPNLRQIATVQIITLHNSNMIISVVAIILCYLILSNTTILTLSSIISSPMAHIQKSNSPNYANLLFHSVGGIIVVILAVKISI